MVAALARLATASPTSAVLLDPTFGIGGSINLGRAARGGIIEPGTGRIIVLMDSGADLGGALAAFLADGSPDATFGAGGRVELMSPGLLVRQPSDGKLLVAGQDAVGIDILLQRYDAGGSLDPTFGVGGRLHVTDPAFLNAVLALPDGRIVVSGQPNGSGGNRVVALLPDGSMDTAFGAGGAIDIGTFVVNALALGPSGTVLAAGGSGAGFRLDRFLPDGSSDAAFGIGGSVQTDIPSLTNEWVTALVVHANGQIIAIGAGSLVDNGLDYHTAAVRYLAGGTLDVGYGAGGTVIAGPAIYGRPAAVGDDDGVVVAFGDRLGRLDSGGQLDTAFAPCRVTSIGGFAVTRQEDGKIVGFSGATAARLTRDTATCQSAASRGSKVAVRAASATPSLRWTWRSSASVALADFGQPLFGSSFTACLLEEQGPTVSDVFFVPASPGRWTSIPSGYKVKSRPPDRYSLLPAYTVRLRAGAPGHASILLAAGQGATLDWEKPSYDPPVVVRLERTGSPFCWEARFSTARTAPGFVATSD